MEGGIWAGAVCCGSVEDLELEPEDDSGLSCMDLLADELDLQNAPCRKVEGSASSAARCERVGDGKLELDGYTWWKQRIGGELNLKDVQRNHYRPPKNSADDSGLPAGNDTGAAVCVALALGSRGTPLVHPHMEYKLPPLVLVEYD